jgi:bacteriocin biosynthesis cyclodehydratase domain-containing protein
VVIGPLTSPGRPGCARCLDRRRAAARPEPGAEAELDLRHGERIARTVSGLLGPHAAGTAATLAQREATAWAAGAVAATDRAAVMLELAMLRVSVHRFLPDLECPFCGAVPDDAPGAAVVAPRSRLKPDAASVRARNLTAMEPALLEHYVDSETGVIVDVRPTAEFPFPTVSARLQPGGPARGEEGYGRTADFRSARLTGIAEALERLGGVRPGGKRTVVRGTYRELHDRALDPRTLGLYPPYQPFVFTNTLEQRIPSFWVMAVDPSGDPDRPKAVCAGGSALDAERGVLNALQELATCLEWRLMTYPRDRARAERLVHDASAVRTMDDHGLLYSHPDAFDRFEFLLTSAPPRSFAEFRQTWHWPRHADLRQDLDEILGRYLGAGLDVLVVDQTRPEHRAAGFACVKVIVPGTLPMTFGHDARRVDGLRRLLEVPHQLGYRDRPLTQADINPHPHPFP